jgi:SulP family sulfate permease
VKRLRDQDFAVESEEERAVLEQAGGRISIMAFTGPMSFAAAADLGHHVRETVEPHQRAVVLDFSDVPFLDVSAARAVETVAVDTKEAGQDLYVAGLSDAGRHTLRELGADTAIDADAFFPTRLAALQKAVAGLG